MKDRRAFLHAAAAAGASLVAAGATVAAVSEPVPAAVLASMQPFLKRVRTWGSWYAEDLKLDGRQPTIADLMEAVRLEHYISLHRCEGPLTYALWQGERLHLYTPRETPEVVAWGIVTGCLSHDLHMDIPADACPPLIFHEAIDGVTARAFIEGMSGKV